MSEPSHDLAVLTARKTLPAELQRADGMKKLNWILSLENPKEFVETLAPDELYHWMHDIGKFDAYPLLEYATATQLRAMVDLDAWTRHELAVPRWLEWLDLALAVDFETAQRFVTAQDNELLLALITGRVQVLPADADTALIPDHLAFYSSPDFLYIVTVPHDDPLSERLTEIMKIFWSADTERAREVFQQAQFELESANSELLERFRTARLQDMGFESPSDALEVFSSIAIKQLRDELDALDGIHPPEFQREAGTVNDMVLSGVEAPELLRGAVAALEPDDRRTFGNGFAYLANKVFMAEVGDLSQMDLLPDMARFAAATANIGLSYLSYESPERAVGVVKAITPELLFKAGWTQLFLLNRRARRLAIRAGYLRGFHLFGRPYDEVIMEARRLRPRFAEALVDREALGTRPFETLDELSRVEAILTEAEQTLDVFEKIFGVTTDTLDFADLPGLSEDGRQNIRFGTLIRTALARELLDGEPGFKPLNREEIRRFSQEAFAPDMQFTERFTQSQSALLALASDDAAKETLERLLSKATHELIEALGGIKHGDVDLHYVGEVFLVQDAG